MKSGPVRDAQQTKQCVYSIPCDCGRCYIGETSIPIKPKCNLTQGLFEKSKLAQNECEEGHKICWKEANVLQIELNTTYRKYKEYAHMALTNHPTNQSTLLGHLSNLGPHYHSRSKETTIPSSVD
jgi:hypothetical protein